MNLAYCYHSVCTYHSGIKLETNASIGQRVQLHHFIFFLCAAVHTRSAFLKVQVPQLVQQPLEPLRRHHVCAVYSLHRPALPVVRGEFCVGPHHLQHHPGHVLPAFHAVLLRREEHGAQGHHDSQNGQCRSLGC